MSTSAPVTPQYQPILDGKAHPDVVNAVKVAYNYIYTLKGQLDQVTSAHQALQKQVAQASSQSQATQQKVASLPSFDVLQSGSSTALKAQASALPAHCTGMAYVATTTGVTFYWDGTNGSSQIQIAWPDGSVTQVPLASLAIAGLTATDTYLFYPSYNTATNMVTFAIVNGGVGTPPVAYAAASIFAAQAADADQMTALSDGPISITLPMTGTTSGNVGGR